jgi:hypothetical protein
VQACVRNHFKFFANMADKHAWERDLHAWDQPDHAEVSDEEVAEFDFNTISTRAAADELGNMIIDLKHRGVLTASQSCTLCFWASKAGVDGIVADLAVHPIRPSGQYSKHWDSVMGRRLGTDDDFYELATPVNSRREGVRSVVATHAWPPLEAVEEDISTTPDMDAALEKAIAVGDLPPSYFDHVVVRAAPAGVPVHGYTLYVDAVKCTRTENAIGFWLRNIITKVPLLLLCLRKTELCACGCRGWCTMSVVMQFLNWSFEAMAAGVRPLARHDQSQWLPSDNVRETIAGLPLRWRAAVLFIKNDMMEFITTFGFPSWGTLGHPCPLCWCTRADWHTIAGIGPACLPWATKTLADYDAACANCEKWVVISRPEVYRHVRAVLAYDKGPAGSRGRALTVDVPELGLRKGDRLEPHAGMPDVAKFDTSAASDTLRVLFWRRSGETVSRRRNPIFNERTGITPDIFVGDWLHMCSLGVYKVFISVLLHALFAANVFRISRHVCPSHEAFVALCVGRLRDMLWAWYAAETSAGRAHARVQAFTTEMVGYDRDHQLGTWGAETNGILLFCHSLLVAFGGMVQRDLAGHLRNGLDGLLYIHNVFKEYECGAIPTSVIQGFSDNWKKHLHALRAMDVTFRPKHHAMAHMVRKIIDFGAPSAWGNWTEESDNRFLKALALRAHRTVWARRVLGEHRKAFGTRRDSRSVVRRLTDAGRR